MHYKQITRTALHCTELGGGISYISYQPFKHKIDIHFTRPLHPASLILNTIISIHSTQT